ncbi:hypothetical protein TBK1r_61120 [Stieleria magnilauensis]|uniref:Uncharacterized protein n=1 Tax=Stieleria magnilauensis TaxID=2527963 RepID=A0ABX5Y4P5_9BACT|nr:hypothetical protein TBK1r_61120 [Planctomycetes bacterium TBK1r]
MREPAADSPPDVARLPVFNAFRQWPYVADRVTIALDNDNCKRRANVSHVGSLATAEVPTTEDADDRGLVASSTTWKLSCARLLGGYIQGGKTDGRGCPSADACSLSVPAGLRSTNRRTQVFQPVASPSPAPGLDRTRRRCENRCLATSVIDLLMEARKRLMPAR